MTMLRKLYQLVCTGFDAAAGGARGVARNELAALRLYSLPRGIRQRSKYCTPCL